MMKKTVLFFALVVFFASSAFAQQETLVVQLGGHACDQCQDRIPHAIAGACDGIPEASKKGVEGVLRSGLLRHTLTASEKLLGEKYILLLRFDEVIGGKYFTTIKIGDGCKINPETLRKNLKQADRPMLNLVKK